MDLPYDENENIDELKDSEESWKELSDYCIDLAACNLHYLMEMKEDEFVNAVKSEIIEKIIEKHL